MYLCGLFIVIALTISVNWSVQALVCRSGAYFDGQKCSLCPAGTYGEVPGLRAPTCSGPCAAGYFCPLGSTSSMQNICGSSIYYCPPGSAARKHVDEGYYTITLPISEVQPQSGNKNAAVEQRLCEPGYYCILGIRRSCSAGSYGDIAGLTSSDCSGVCPKGFYCLEATSNPVPCPPGTYGDEKGLSTPSCSGRCPIGHYCESGSILPKRCPAGTFGKSRDLTTRACSSQCTTSLHGIPRCLPSPCPAGFYCPLATVTPIPCGDVGLFCPEGSMQPTTVSAGYYTIWTDTAWPTAIHGDGTGPEDPYLEGAELAVLNQTTRTSQQRCERGAYCVNGVKKLCPPGVYGDVEGLTSAACIAPCPAGYFCPLGTFNYYQHPCTTKNSFCRAGSAAPNSVTPGYYTIVSPASNLRIDQVICPMGSYCVNGIAYLCPVGMFGATTGLTAATCSGRCQDGYICGLGSTSATQSPCPAGSYSQNGLMCSPCAPGYWCDAASPVSQQHECGTDTVFCPLGSSAPQNVADGWFAVGQAITTHTSQQFCSPQNVKHLPQCPTRTIGTKSGL